MIAKCNEFIINIVMNAHILILNRTCKKQARQNKFEAKATTECQIFISQRTVFNFISS